MAAMYEAVKGAIPLAVRTPAQHAALDDNTAKITGFFNDALMASQTDFGTFSSDSDKRDEEYRYVDECLKNGVLCGGEAVTMVPMHRNISENFMLHILTASMTIKF